MTETRIAATAQARRMSPKGLKNARGLARRSALVLALAVGSSALGVESVALAQGAPGAVAPKKGDKKAAGALFKRGKELFEQKDYRGAKDAFAQSEDVRADARAEYWLGRCAEELGDGAEAVGWYEKALLDTTLKQHDDAKDRAAKLKAKPVVVRVTLGMIKGASIRVDGVVSTVVTPGDVGMTPGPHKVVVSAPGMKDSEQEVTVVALKPMTLDFKLETGSSTPPPPPDGPVAGGAPLAPPAVGATDPGAVPAPSPVATTPPPEPAPTPSTGPTDHTWAYVTGGAAVVSLGFYGYFGLKTLSDHSDYTAPGGNTPERHDDGTHHALLADIGLGLGLTFAITSIVLFVSDSPAEAPPATAPAPHATIPARATSPAFTLLPFVGAPTAGKAATSAGAIATLRF